MNFQQNLAPVAMGEGGRGKTVELFPSDPTRPDKTQQSGKLTRLHYRHRTARSLLRTTAVFPSAVLRRFPPIALRRNGVPVWPWQAEWPETYEALTAIGGEG